MVKLVILSPLLDLTGFHLPPFQTRLEIPIKINLDQESKLIQGQMDILVIQEQIWTMVIESKRSEIAIMVGLPQVLAYRLASPTPDRTHQSQIKISKWSRMCHPYAPDPDFIL